jgi:hypothetical protein
MEPYRNFRHLEELFGVTWRDLVELEPTLEELLRIAQQRSVLCRRWADVDRFFAPIRSTLSGLVGLTRKNQGHPVLASAQAYEVAYWKLYDAVAGMLPVGPGGAATAHAARKLSSTLAISHWPRYVPLPTERGLALNWED